MVVKGPSLRQSSVLYNKNLLVTADDPVLSSAIRMLTMALILGLAVVYHLTGIDTVPYVADVTSLPTTITADQHIHSDAHTIDGVCNWDMKHMVALVVP